MTQVLLEEGAFDGLLWQNTWQSENEVFIAFHNGGTEQSCMKATAQGEAAELLFGSAESTYKNGVLSVVLPPGSTVIFRMLTERKTGVYSENILYANTYVGEVVFENYDNSVAGIYKGKELIRLLVGGEKVDREGKIKIFRWTKLNPQAKVQEIQYSNSAT